MVKKSAKSLYLAEWVQQLLTDEEEIVGQKPNVVASAAIYHFAAKSVVAKKAILKDYFSADVEKSAPEEIVAAAEALSAIDDKKKTGKKAKSV